MVKSVTGSSNYKVSGKLTVNQVEAGGEVGSNGQVLTSNGSSTFWSINPGYTGSVGPQGPQGFQGVQGELGPQGFQGVQGVIGAQGNQGVQGELGTQGFQGVQGDTGPQGVQGALGPQGFQGVQGVQGDTGPQGYQGVQGDTGPQGYQGVQGDTGPQGYQGFQGVIGAQGHQGFQGDTGPQGNQGYQGVQGTAGTSVSIIDSVADVNAAYPGGGPNDPDGYLSYYYPSAVTGNGVIDEATGNLWVFTGSIWDNVGQIVGPQGPQGQQGNTGPQGFQGVQGDIGSQGYQGVQGALGPQGPQGFQGVQGDVGAQGFQGVQGDTGPQGFQGAVGAQGFQGVQGDVGSQGVQGELGPQGFQGVQGSTGPQGVQGASATTITAADDTTTASLYPVMVDAAGTAASPKVTTTKLYFDASTGTMSATNFNSLSDVNMKTNIEPLIAAVEILNTINPVSFDWKDTGLKGYGVIAQEIEKILPELVHTNPDGRKTVSYDQIIPFLLSVVQDQQKELIAIRLLLTSLVNDNK